MWFFRSLVVCFAFIAFGSSLNAETIRVVSWNMKWFPGGRPGATVAEQTRQMSGAQQALRSLKPDILLLQEVANEQAVEQLVSVLKDFRVQVVSDFKGRPQNLAIATNLPTVSAWAAGWKRNGKTEAPRGYAFAAIQLPGNALLLTYSVHFKSNLGEAAKDAIKRTEAAMQLLDHIVGVQADYEKKASNIALVVGGDFNTSLDDQQFASDPTLRLLRQTGLYWTFDGVPFAERITIPASGRYPENCFDHIFAAGLGKPRAHVVQIAGVSDHYPVVLDIETKDISTFRLKLPGRSVGN